MAKMEEISSLLSSGIDWNDKKNLSRYTKSAPRPPSNVNIFYNEIKKLVKILRPYVMLDLIIRNLLT